MATCDAQKIEAEVESSSKADVGAKIVKESRLMPVTVLSGFLGAGKTTVLREILTNTKGLRVAMIVNDMAALNVDALEIGEHVEDMTSSGSKKRKKNEPSVALAAAAEKSADVDEKDGNDEERADVLEGCATATKPKMVALQNGCICCTLREDLIQQVAELANASEKYHYLVIESTGISEPVPVAQTFCHSIQELQALATGGDEGGNCGTAHADGTPHANGTDDKKLAVQALELKKLVNLDTMVTVVDCAQFFEVFGSLDNLKDSKWSKREAAQVKEGEIDLDRTIADLLVDQVEFADVLILNKRDLLLEQAATPEQGADKLATLEKIIRKLNPVAQILQSEYGKVPVEKLLGTGLFNFDTASSSAGWMRELAHGGVVGSAEGHKPETEEYGISSVVFRAERPFIPKKLEEILGGFGDLSDLVNKFRAESSGSRSKSKSKSKTLLKGVIRSKGKIWLANCHSYNVIWHSVGRQFRLEHGPPFMGALMEAGYEVGGQDRYDPHAFEMEPTSTTSKTSSDGTTLKPLASAWGFDRKTELVLIGAHLDKERIIKALEDALVPEEEFVLATQEKLRFERFVLDTYKNAGGNYGAVTALTLDKLLEGTGGLKTSCDRFLAYDDPFFNRKLSGYVS